MDDEGQKDNGIAAEQLKQYIDRIERMEEEKRDLTTTITSIYNEAKSNGFDAKVIRQIIRLRKMDQNEVDEEEALLHLYKQALGMR
jgi:uncharacterized protein (UPF0335 family)